MRLCDLSEVAVGIVMFADRGMQFDPSVVDQPSVHEKAEYLQEVVGAARCWARQWPCEEVWKVRKRS